MPNGNGQPSDRRRRSIGGVLGVWVLLPLAAWAALFLLIAWLMR
jgi:hypothetical protein